MQFLDGIGAVQTLNELMEERSQRFDSSAHEQIHTEAAELNVLHVNTKHHSAAQRRSTSKKTRETESVVSEARRRQQDRPMIDFDRQNCGRVAKERAAAAVITRNACDRRASPCEVRACIPRSREATKP